MTDILFPALGGLGIFLIGMKLLADGLIAFAGDSLRRGLMRFAGTPFKAFVSGTLATALVQSSSATTVTLIGFVSAGLVNFNQAIGMVIGASLGNTATGWLVAGLGLRVNLGFYTLPLIGVGALLKLLVRGKTADIGMAISGFGLIFLGLDTLQQGMQGLAAQYQLSSLPHGNLASYFLVMLIGLAMTTIMQSSTAAIATTLAAYHAGAISFDQSAALVVGAAIGTTVTGALVTIGATSAAKRTALANILFNLVAGLLAIALLPALIALVGLLNQHFGLSPGALSLAAFHTLFISLGVVIVLPFTEHFGRLICRLLPEKGDPLTTHLDDSLLALPPVALEAAHRTLTRLTSQLFDNFRTVLDSGSTPIVRRKLADLHVALDHSYDFLTRVQIPSDSDALNVQRSAMLHAIDHLYRLCRRLQLLESHPIDFEDSTFHWAVEGNQQLLALADRALACDVGDDTVASLTQQAEALDGMAHTVRNQVLKDESLARAAGNALRTTDAFRWLARSGQHIDRICHYLNQARLRTSGASSATTAPAPVASGGQ